MTPPIQISEKVEIFSTDNNCDSVKSKSSNSATSSYNDESNLLTSSQISEYSEDRPSPSTYTALKDQNAFTPRTEYLVRQTSQLVERICEDNGVSLQKHSFANNLIGREDDILKWSATKHESVLKIVDYLQKRSLVEREYSNALQKLNRQIIQSGDTDERLGQLVIIGEKTATGHMDISRKINEHTLLDDLKTICSEHEILKRRILADIKTQREIWRKSVSHIEKIRNNRDKLMAAVDSAQLNLDTAISRGNLNSSGLKKLKEDLVHRQGRAKVACEEYNQALKNLTVKQKEIFRDQLPNHYKNLERIERARISSVRSTIINVAQVHLAIANIETESGERWLNSLVSTSVDDEIENFVKNQLFEKPSGGEDLFYLERLMETQEVEVEVKIFKQQEPQSVEQKSTKLPNVSTSKELLKPVSTVEQKIVSTENEFNSSPLNQLASSGLYANLTNSESNLLEIDTSNILEENDPIELMYKKAKLNSLIKKLSLQIEGLVKMKAAYESDFSSTSNSNESTIQVICKSIKEISKEVHDARDLIKQIDIKTLGASGIDVSGVHNSNNGLLSQSNPMMSILVEMNKLEERRKLNQQPPIQQTKEEVPKKKKEVKPKRSLSKSFEDLLKSNDQINNNMSNSSVDLLEEGADPVEVSKTVHDLGPEIQKILECTSKFNERIEAENENIPSYDEELISERRMFRKRLGSAGSTESTDSKPHDIILLRPDNIVGIEQQQQQQQIGRKSSAQSTLSAAANEKMKYFGDSNLVPMNSAALFRVQSLYNFIGRKETDELDLRTGEILTIYDATGEWWEAENEAGVRGYIPFNYVIKI